MTEQNTQPQSQPQPQKPAALTPEQQSAAAFAELTQIVHSLRDVTAHLGKLSAFHPTAASLARSVEQGLRHFAHL